MFKIKVNLVTLTDIKKFVNIAEKIPNDVELIDNYGHKVNAKSLLGCMYSVEFNETFVVSDYCLLASAFKDFMI